MKKTEHEDGAIDIELVEKTKYSFDFVETEDETVLWLWLNDRCPIQLPLEVAYALADYISYYRGSKDY